MDMVRLLVLTAGGAAIAWALRIPSGFLVGAMVATASGNLLVGRQIAMPAPLLAVGMALIGGQVGSSMTRETLRSLGTMLPLAVASVVVLILAGILVAMALRTLTAMPFLDAVFSASPGAINAITGMAVREGANAPLVASFHVLRIVMVTLSLPLLLRIAR